LSRRASSISFRLILLRSLGRPLRLEAL
jgi:hypothetical protein